MKKSLLKQRGMSFWSLVFVLGFIALVTLFALRAFPLYNQKLAVITSMNNISTTSGAAKMSRNKVAELLVKNFIVNNVDAISHRQVKKHMKLIKSKDGGPPTLQVFFDMENKLFADLFLKMNFNHEVLLKGPE